MTKVVLVTGSSRGIGKAIAQKFADNGYSVAINYVKSDEAAESFCKKLINQGVNAKAYKADVSDKKSVLNMITQIEKDLGKIDVLVNNAGIAKQLMFQDITDEYLKRIFEVNVFGAVYCSQAVLSNMLHNKKGSIINISSIWGLRGASCEVAYSSTKSALIGLTRSLAKELAPSNIRVNCVAPGVIDTDMLKPLGEETIAEVRDEIPMGRLGSPQDIAEAVFYFASDISSYATGQVLTLDGAFIL